jgi:hypothetical protein
LLIAVSADALEQVLSILQSAGIHCCNEPIGRITAPGEKCIQVMV